MGLRALGGGGAPSFHVPSDCTTAQLPRLKTQFVHRSRIINPNTAHVQLLTYIKLRNIALCTFHTLWPDYT